MESTRMRWLFFFLCLALLGSYLVEARKRGRRPKPGKPIKTCNKDSRVCVRSYGKSGRFTITRGNRTDSHPQTTTISFFSIKEKNAKGQIVGSAGPKQGRHSFHSFKDLDFKFSDEERTTYKGIEAIRYNFSSTIPGPNATLNVPMYLFTENGTIDVCDDEEVGIVDGVLKYNIEIYNWKFCNGLDCSSRRRRIAQYGEFVDFVIHVKKKGKAYRGRRHWRKKGRGKGRRKGKWRGRGKGKRVKAQKFFFGGTTSIAFPSVLSRDGQCTEMPEGFPALRVKKKGAEYAVVFRFPKFNNSVVYDPVVNVQDKPGEPEGNVTASSNATASTGSAIANATAIAVTPINGTMGPTPPSRCSSFQLLPTLNVAVFLIIFVRLFV